MENCTHGTGSPCASIILRFFIDDFPLFPGGWPFDDEQGRRFYVHKDAVFENYMNDVFQKWKNLEDEMWKTLEDKVEAGTSN